MFFYEVFKINFLSFPCSKHPACIQSKPSGNEAAVITILAGLFWSFAFIFFYCELGQRVSDSFDEITGKIELFRWYAFPLKVQQMLPIMLSVSQQDVVVQGFGNLACSRLVFKQVNDFNMTTTFQFIKTAIESLSGSECRFFIFYGSSWIWLKLESWADWRQIGYSIFFLTHNVIYSKSSIKMDIHHSAESTISYLFWTEFKNPKSLFLNETNFDLNPNYLHRNIENFGNT